MGPRKARAWEHLSDQDLLEVRICDLEVRIEDSDLPPRIAQLYEELAAVRLLLRPVFYLSDEWFTPDRQTAIGIPFYLAHPRLKALEFRMMFEVEGGTPSWCMRLLRHETAHALDHAFGIHKDPQWHRSFGPPSARYTPEFYPVDPHSKAHVRNLANNYAQCHPEEDFAETFAVWLNPNSQWRSRYEGWPAMRKLRYLDRLMRDLALRLPPNRKPELVSEARTLRSTLASYYARKIRIYQLNDLSFTLPVMRGIFRSARDGREEAAAADFIRRHKREMVDSIAAWSGERRARVSQVLAKLARLCEDNRLVLRDGEEPSLVRISTYAATLILNRLHTHTYRTRKL